MKCNCTPSQADISPASFLFGERIIFSQFVRAQLASSDVLLLFGLPFLPLSLCSLGDMGVLPLLFLLQVRLNLRKALSYLCTSRDSVAVSCHLIRILLSTFRLSYGLLPIAAFFLICHLQVDIFSSVFMVLDLRGKKKIIIIKRNKIKKINKTFK